MNHSAMEASKKPRLRRTAEGSFSLPLSSTSARFHSGCSASSAIFSSCSFFSRMAANRMPTEMAMMPATMAKSGR